MNLTKPPYLRKKKWLAHEKDIMWWNKNGSKIRVTCKLSLIAQEIFFYVNLFTYIIWAFFFASSQRVRWAGPSFYSIIYLFSNFLLIRDQVPGLVLRAKGIKMSRQNTGHALKGLCYGAMRENSVRCWGATWIRSGHSSFQGHLH